MFSMSIKKHGNLMSALKKKTKIMIFGTGNDEKYNFKLGENSI